MNKEIDPNKWKNVEDMPIPLFIEVVAVDNEGYAAIGSMEKLSGKEEYMFMLNKPLANFNEHKIIAWMFSIGVPKNNG